MVCIASTRDFKKEEESCGHTHILMEIESNWITWWSTKSGLTVYKIHHSLESISTDHRIVPLRIKLCLRANKKKSNAKIAYNWEHLINNEDLQNPFSTSLRNLYNILQHEYTNESANNANQDCQSSQRNSWNADPSKRKSKTKSAWKNEIIIEKKKTTKKACTNEK